MSPMTIALIAFVFVLLIGAILYFRPRILNEGFTTLAVDSDSMPKCFLRDADAQRILAEVKPSQDQPPASASSMALAELTLILQKVLCIDADITGSAAGVYSTYRLPFATAHDIEPAASFVGRCVRNAARSRDIEVAMDKFEGRGKELIVTLCANKTKKEHDRIQSLFHDVVARATRNIARACLTEKATLDRPAGPRDPGFYEPDEVKELRPYTIRGDVQYF